MYVIRNGIIVQPDRLLFGYELVVEDDRIAAIQRQGKFDATAAGAGVIDAHGGYVTPGLVDIHSDYIETVISPRPTVLMDFSTALFEAERELMCQLEDTRFDRLTFCKRFAWQLARQPFFAFVLEEDDVVGIVNVRVERQLHHEHPVAEICELVVDKGYRGGGRGTLLLERAIACAREQGCEVIEVTSNAARLGAHRFYENHGMKRTHAKFMMGL